MRWIDARAKSCPDGSDHLWPLVGGDQTQWNGDTSLWKEEASRPRKTAGNTEAFESLNSGFLMPNGEAPSNPPDGQDALERYGADLLSIVLISSEKPARFLTKFPS
jgi:hypothetical protein